MTQDEIIAMARQVGITCKVLDDEYCDSVGMKRGSVGRIESVKFIELELFASLVAAKEREACAQLCDAERMEYLERSAKNNGRESDFAFGSVNSAERIAAAIRARGQKEGA